MNIIDSQAVRTQRMRFWLWVTVLGILFSIAACSIQTFHQLVDQSSRAFRTTRAHRVMDCIRFHREHHDEKPPESLEEAFNSEFGAEASEQMQHLAPADGESWHYFKPPDKTQDVRVVILVSPRCEQDYRWLRGKRVIGWSDGNVEVVKDEREVPLPDGRTVRLSDLQ